MASLRVDADGQTIPSAGGSPNMPGNDAQAQGPGRGADQKGDRFRFDAASTESFIKGQERGQLQSSFTAHNGCPDHQFSNFSGSQGNLNYLTHNSCTSIPQNLSTSDQQPLIVDVRDHCHHNCSHSKDNPASRCCLETTSFMGGHHHQVTPNCSYCEQEMKSALYSPFGVSNEHPAQQDRHADDGDGPVHHDGQVKSRTLTRVYKPLNDIQFSDQSTTKNMAEDFYTQTNLTKASKRL